MSGSLDVEDMWRFVDTKRGEEAPLVGSGLGSLGDVPVGRDQVRGVYAVIRGPEQVLAVKTLLGVDLGPVDKQPALVVPLEVPPAGGVAP